MKKSHVGLLERDDAILYSGEKAPTDAEIAELERGGEDEMLLKRLESIGYVLPSLKAQEEARLVKIAELRATKARIETPQPLATALRQAGVKPFKAESVEKYKKAMLRKPLQLMEHPMLSFEKESVTIAFTFVALLCTILFCGCMGWSTLTIMLGYYVEPVVISLFAIVPVVFVLIGGALSKSEEDHPTRSRIGEYVLCFGFGPIAWFDLLFCGPRNLEWKKTPLQGYTKDIPRSVASTIVEIGHFCPQATFEVDELTRKPDPFLVVTLGKEQYFVEVWDEPRFTADRIA